MKHNEYRGTFRAARQELMTLLKQRQKLDARIAKLQPLVESLQSFYVTEAAKKPSPEQLLGMTDAVRSALQQAAMPLSATEIKLRMEKAGFDCSKYTNPLASIHTVVKRLVRSQQVRVVPEGRGRKKYAWVTLADRLLQSLQEITERASAAKQTQAGGASAKR